MDDSLQYLENLEVHKKKVVLTILTWRTCALLNSVQKFIEIQS